ncbi:MAG: thiopurine S-methyltransferase [Myxococcota bacterium]|nr:thiopurine S-methyltransferase [Myxococcota bacterium]
MNETIQDKDAWHARWQSGQIGFHRDQPNTSLQRHSSHLEPGRILLPLCGKSVDMIWLSTQAFTVVGVELVPKAINAFFSENNMTPEIRTEKERVSYRSDRVTIYHSDFFLLSTSNIGQFDALYDRAALVALEPGLREQYAQHCLDFLRPGGTLLLLTYDLPRPITQGPPFPVRNPSVPKLYAQASSVQLLEEITYDQTTEPRLKERGLQWSKEAIWKIRK